MKKRPRRHSQGHRERRDSPGKGEQTLVRIGRDIRQRAYPREWSIGSPDWTAVDLAKVTLQKARMEQPQQPPSTESHEQLRSRLKAYANLATSLWRLKRRMVDPNTGEPLPEMMRAYRYFESAWDTLKSMELEVYDFDGKIHDAGMALNVIAFEPTPGLDRERIIETMRPAVICRKKVIQRADVMIGQPAAEQPENAASRPRGPQAEDDSNLS